MTTACDPRRVGAMDRGPFEFCFEIEPVSETVEDAIADRFDCLISSHSSVTTVTITANGESCVRAAREAIDDLSALGVTTLRLMDDLVDRGEIARRAGVTRQAVGLWVRGERHTGTPFPAPYVLAAGGLWLWGEVLEALRRRGVTVDDPMVYPTRADSSLINGSLTRTRALESGAWTKDLARRAWSTPVPTTKGRRQVPIVMTSAHLSAVS